MALKTIKSLVEIKVPATTANLGPGFDCLGMALDIWNTIRMGTGGSSIKIDGEGANFLSRGDDNLVYTSAAALFREIGEPVPPLMIACIAMNPGAGVHWSVTSRAQRAPLGLLMCFMGVVWGEGRCYKPAFSKNGRVQQLLTLDRL